MVELGQSLFGNKWESEDAPDFVGRDLYSLSEMLGHRSPDNQAHGLLGGAWGYGQDFENDVFVMFPYYWGDCTCGYERLEYKWDKANNHESTCYQAELDKLGGHDYGNKQRDAEIGALCGRLGLPYPDGSAVHCTCDYSEKWAAFLAENSHDPVCPEVRPNFLHKASGLAVHWYKYIGRGMTASRVVAYDEWLPIYEDCRQSLLPRAVGNPQRADADPVESEQ